MQYDAAPKVCSVYYLASNELCSIGNLQSVRWVQVASCGRLVEAVLGMRLSDQHRAISVLASSAINGAS